MLYLNEKAVRQLGTPWSELINVVTCASRAVSENLHSQPLKVYLRYGDAINRIIAMPAYIPVPAPVAGLKWIASFPKNLDRGLPRAHSVTVLNDSDTGRPTAVINTALISCLRTAAVSGALLNQIFEVRGRPNGIRIAIIGFGPIGRAHYELCNALFTAQIEQFTVYDRRRLSDLDAFAPDLSSGRLRLADSWEQAFDSADIVITCTAGTPRYIDSEPSPTGIYLNISLRDYFPRFLGRTSTVVVDDWDAVCREDTDVHRAFLCHGLTKAETLPLASVLLDPAMSDRLRTSVIFNPMGLAVYDIAIGALFVEHARQRGIGLNLPS